MSKVDDEIFSAYLKATELVKIKVCSNDLHWALIQQLMRLSSAADKVVEVEEGIIKSFNKDDYINEFDLDETFNLSSLFDDTDDRVLVLNAKLFTTMTLKNFATRDLYSIVARKNGNLKTRIFVHLSTNDMGFVPIHRHKYEDVFTPLFGNVTDITYTVLDEHSKSTTPYKELIYPRLSSSYDSPTHTGNIKHLKVDKRYSHKHTISTDDYHTVAASGFCAWMIEEISENADFPQEPLCYVSDDMINKNFNTIPATDSELELLVKILSQNGYIVKWS